MPMLHALCRADGATQVRDTVVAVHPGLVQTDLARQWVHNKFPILAVRGLIDTLFQWTFLPPAYAVETVLHAITAPAHEVRACCK